MDAWLGALLGEVEIDSAELLLVNPDYIDTNYLTKLAKKEHLQNTRGIKLSLGSFEKDIFEIKALLRWRHDNIYQETASTGRESLDSVLDINVAFLLR